MRVLYLEDDPIQLDVVEKWLASSGHAVVGVPDGIAAIKALERAPFDLAILDWHVPGVSGQDVLNWIRQRQPEIPVVFATASGGEFEAAAMFELGADDYVVKPLRRLEFVARIEAIARRFGVGSPRRSAFIEPVAGWESAPSPQAAIARTRR